MLAADDANAGLMHDINKRIISDVFAKGDKGIPSIITID